MADFCDGVPVPNCKSGEVKIIAVRSPVAIEPHREMYQDPSNAFSSSLQNSRSKLQVEILSAPIVRALRAYVPQCVLQKVDAGQDASWLAELRTATVIFVNLKDLVLDKKGNDSPALAHQILSVLQPIIVNNGGYRRQYLVDDKGSVLIVVFGVPPFAHSDDAYRAVKTALEMKTALVNIKVGASLGVATGSVYVGSVGSPFRREHAVVGDTVNTSARLAGKAKTGGILCDEQTAKAVGSRVVMKAEGSINVKGKNLQLKIFSPIQSENKALFLTDENALGESFGRVGEIKLVCRLCCFRPTTTLFRLFLPWE